MCLSPLAILVEVIQRTSLRRLESLLDHEVERSALNVLLASEGDAQVTILFLVDGDDDVPFLV